MLAEDRQRHPRRSIIVTATRWSGGWELEIGEHQHTQVRDLRNARQQVVDYLDTCLLYTSPSPRDGLLSRMPSSA